MCWVALSVQHVHVHMCALRTVPGLLCLSVRTVCLWLGNSVSSTSSFTGQSRGGWRPSHCHWDEGWAQQCSREPVPSGSRSIACLTACPPLRLPVSLLPSLLHPVSFVKTEDFEWIRPLFFYLFGCWLWREGEKSRLGVKWGVVLDGVNPLSFPHYTWVFILPHVHIRMLIYFSLC